MKDLTQTVQTWCVSYFLAAAQRPARPRSCSSSWTAGAATSVHFRFRTSGASRRRHFRLPSRGCPSGLTGGTEGCGSGGIRVGWWRYPETKWSLLGYVNI